MIAFLTVYVLLLIVDLSYCAVNVANGKYLWACISAVAVIWGVCIVARMIKNHLNYTKIKKSIEKEYAEQRKAFEYLMSPFPTREEYGGNWYRWTYKKEPNIYHGRIAHLAFRHKKARVRKKNMKRILKGK